MGNNEENTQNNEEQAQDQKTFTQDEVEEIVKRRLARERRKTEREQESDSGTDRDITLEERELRVMAREKLFDEGLPSSLADVLKYSDEKSLTKAIEVIKGLEKQAPKSWGQRQGSHVGKPDPIRKAMGLNR